MSWYKLANYLNDLLFKPGDQVYIIDSDGKIKEYGIIYDTDEDIAYGWWGDTPKETMEKYNSEDKDGFLEERMINDIAVGRFPINFLMRLLEDEELLGHLQEYNFIQNQLDTIVAKKVSEVNAQSLYNLDLPIPSDLGGINTERIWMYDLNAPNLWWGEGKHKWEGGTHDVIQGLPRYNPEYHDDEIGAFFTWWEPYIEPVGYDDLMNVQRSMNAYFYPGKYTEHPPRSYM
jgi:hypothetical protein